LLLCTCVLSNATAWGPDGHTVIGVLAVEQIDPKALAELKVILGATDLETIGGACNWPDQYRETDEGSANTSRYHYINIPRSQTKYDRQRDCPGNNCVTEQIKRFATELEDTRLDTERRKQAFSWVCHLVGDVHQPLHAGYRDDRGGNNVEIVFNKRPMNLHSFWDSGLISSKGFSQQELAEKLMPKCGAGTSSIWHFSEPDRWTEESHALVAKYSYPSGKKISTDFSQQSWDLIQKQLVKAADRLATVINATLGQGDVLLRENGKQ
jgi:hypothetical protein